MKKIPTQIDNGYILISRNILESRLWSLSPAARLIAFYLLLSANHKIGYFRGKEILRGQTIRSIPRISEDTGFSDKAVRCAIGALEQIGFLIKAKPFGAKQVQVLSICNYETYQNPDNYKGKGGTGRGTGRGAKEVPDELPPNNNEIKKEQEKQKENIPLLFPQGEIGLIADYRKWTEEDFKKSVWEYSDQYFDSELQNFFEYWTEKTPKGKMRFQLAKTWSTGRRISNAKRMGVLESQDKPHAGSIVDTAEEFGGDDFREAHLLPPPMELIEAHNTEYREAKEKAKESEAKSQESKSIVEITEEF